MSRKVSPEDQLDGLLGELLNSGWNDPAPQAQVADQTPMLGTPKKPKRAKPAADQRVYPPLPQRDAGTTYSHPHVGETDPQASGLTVYAPPPPQDDAGEDFDRATMLDIGLLTDLATGRKTAAEAGTAAGLSQSEVQSALATALHEMDPKEVLKALGVQKAEQQLKSGALYGAVLAELVNDMMHNKMRAETKIELAKMLAKVGGLEPKEDKTVGPNNGFVLNINLGAATAQPITIVQD